MRVCTSSNPALASRASNGCSLIVTMLQQQPAAADQAVRRAVDDLVQVRQAVVACHQCALRLVLQRGQMLVTGSNVRRVRQREIEAPSRHREPPVAPHRFDGQAERLRIAAGRFPAPTRWHRPPLRWLPRSDA